MNLLFLFLSCMFFVFLLTALTSLIKQRAINDILTKRVIDLEIQLSECLDIKDEIKNNEKEIDKTRKKLDELKGE